MTALLEADGVWKAYPRWRAGEPTLRAVLHRRMPLVVRGRDRRFALRDVSFALRAGEALGVIGHNGAGKSTLLRLAAGLGRPTRGRLAAVHGTAGVLSLGGALDPTLTGRENAATIATVLGLDPPAVRRVVPAALRFAELEEFADAPVRAYSDGMRLRLAFGVLGQTQPRLLVVDEALAVGDAAFQERCLERIREMRAAGAALLLASHDLHQVQAECERALWLHGGELRADGPAADVVVAYRESGRAETLTRTPAGGDGAGELGVSRWGSQELAVEAVRVLGPGGRPAQAIAAGDAVSVELRLEPRRAGVRAPHVVLELKRRADGLLCHEASSDGALALGPLDGPLPVTAHLGRLDLVPGEYVVCAAAYPPDWSYAYDYRWDVARVTVTGRTGPGVLRPPVRWEVSRPRPRAGS